MGKEFGKALVYLLSAVAIGLWGFSYIWSNALIGQGVPIAFFVFIRIVLAAVLLLAFNLVTGAFQSIRREHLIWFLLLAFCEPLVYFLAETYGIKETGSPSISAMVISTVPIVSLIVGATVFKERLTHLNVVGVLLTFFGIILVLFCKIDTGVAPHFALGILLLVVAVLAEVGHASFTKKLSEYYSPQNIAMYQFCFGAIFFLPFFLTEGLEGFDPGTMFTWSIWRPILCLAVLCSSLAFSLWAMTIKRLGVARSSVFLAMIAVVTAVSAALMGQETLDARHWLGVCISSVGVILSQWVPKSSGAR